jgi:hypothetical protein
MPGDTDDTGDTDGGDDADGTGGAGDRTEQLRDLFVDVAGAETVTEEQAEGRGSLTDRSVEDAADVVADMRERYPFATDLDAETHVAVLERFHDGADDDAVADALGLDASSVTLARLDCHHHTDADLDPPFDADAAAERLGDPTGDAVRPDEDAVAAVAGELDADPAAVERFAAARRARNRSLRAGGRFREALEAALADGDLTGRLASDVHEDGLEDATEDAEVDVEF